MNNRQMEIMNIISKESKINVNELARKFNVSQVTIRQDLRALDKQGMLKRVHGGAVAITDDRISNRMCLNYRVKKRIAREASKMVQDGETVMIESGSTAAILARELANKKEVTIVTNSLFIANHVKELSNINVILLGGILQKAAEVTVGPLIRSSLDNIYVDKFFIGVDGFTEETGFTSIDMMRAETVRCMAKRAKNVVVITDSTKFGVRGVTHLLDTEAVSTVITDSGIGKDYEDFLIEKNVKLIKV